MDNNHITNLIKEILEKDNRIYVAYIFGSFNKKEFTEDSDIDIAIYSDLSYNELLDYKIILEEKIGRDIDLVNIEKVYPAIQLQIMIRSEILFVNNEDKFWQWYDKFKIIYNTDVQLWKKGCILDGMKFD